MKKIKNIRFNGFTLIELLVVMMIVAALAGMSLFSFQGARKQGRDAKRKADLEVIRSALELYKADCNRYPPSSGGGVPSPLNGSGCGLSANVYLQSVPKDPSTNTNYTYALSGTNRYTITATLEDCTGSGCNYQVTNP